MDIVRENIDDLNAVLKITVQPDDYQEKYNSTLKHYSKNAKMSGFRPGKVPMSVIKKKYGKSILVEEINQAVSKSLQNYISENEINILGNPLPKEDAEVKGDWDNPKDFEFEYAIGLAPEFEIPLSDKSQYTYYKVKVDDELIQKQIDDLARRYGKLEAAETSDENSMLFGQFVELNEDGSIKEGGIMNSSTISLEFIEDKKVQEELIGKKVGDELNLNPKDVSRNETDLASMLDIKSEELPNISDLFKFTINEVKAMQPAELNQELFDKLYGEGEIESEEGMRERVKQDLENMFAKDSDRILQRDISDDLMNKIDIELPDAFLKRWIKASSEEENLTAEKIEEDYENYHKGMKWQLIQNKIFKKNDIQITEDEALQRTQSLIINQYAQYGIPAPEAEELQSTAKQVLSNNQESQRIYDSISEDKLLAFFKEKVQLKEKEVDYDKFVEIAQQENQ